MHMNNSQKDKYLNLHPDTVKSTTRFPYQAQQPVVGVTTEVCAHTHIHLDDALSYKHHMHSHSARIVAMCNASGQTERLNYK